MSESPKYFDEFVNLWESSSDEISEEKYISQSIALGEYAKLNNQFIAVFNAKNQQTLYLSDNYLEVLGYTCSESDYKKRSSFYWMRDLPIEQSWFFLKMSVFFRTRVQPILKGKMQSKNLNWFVHNFKLKPMGGNGQIKHLSILGQGLEIGENGNLLILMTIIKETSSFIKNKNTWWAEFRVNTEHVFMYHHDIGKFQTGSILSDREKEVLKLVEAGFDSHSIAEHLDISSHTIDTHRKNMLDKTGVKDFSSLIQLCKEGRVI